MATDFSTLITSNFSVDKVLTSAGPIVAGLAVIALGLSVGPKYAIKAIGWMRSVIR